MKNLHVFIIHSKALSVRRQLCNELVLKLEQSALFGEIKTTFVESYEASDISIEMIRSLVNLNKISHASIFNGLIRNLHIRQLSNCLKHNAALKMIEQLGQNDYGLVIEDDVIFADDVANSLSETIVTLDKMNNKWDVHFLGLPQPLNNTKGVNVTSVHSIFKVLPEVSSYLVTSDGAKKMCEVFFPIKFATNIQFMYIADEISRVNQARPLLLTMSAPNVFVDGSKYGYYLSSLSPNNKLILNQDYVALHSRLAKNDPYTSDEIISIRNKFDTIKFKNHPDMQALRAKFEMDVGNFALCKSICDACYKIYMENDCILNGESEFLLLYTSVFKHHQ